jgi:hypothetical protein
MLQVRHPVGRSARLRCAKRPFGAAPRGDSTLFPLVRVRAKGITDDEEVYIIPMSPPL